VLLRIVGRDDLFRNPARSGAAAQTSPISPRWGVGCALRVCWQLEATAHGWS
jgi:hypothetical protein